MTARFDFTDIRAMLLQLVTHPKWMTTYHSRRMQTNKGVVS